MVAELVSFETSTAVTFSIVNNTFEYYNENDRKQRERSLILSIPKEKRLNFVLPRV